MYTNILTYKYFKIILNMYKYLNIEKGVYS